MTHMDDTFKFALLSRCKEDCIYYLGCGGRDAKHSLWAKNEEAHISTMRELYDSLTSKPQWITLEEINNFAQAMGVR